MRSDPGRRRSSSLREAISVVFALIAILPILLLVFLLSRARLLEHGEAQIGIGVAVVVSILGYLILRRMMAQITRVAHGLQAAVAGQAAALEGEATGSPPSAVSEVSEIAQLGGAFYRMLDDLRGATQRLEDLVFKLGTLNETVELAARVPRIQDLLGLVLQNTMRAVRASIGSIMILDPDHQALRVAVSQGLPPDAAEAEVRVGEGIAGRVLQLGEPVLVDDIETDPRFTRPNAPAYGNGSFLCLPIRAGDRVIGVINMGKGKDAPGTPRIPPFSPIDLQFLNTLMTYIGYSVDNARLLQEAQQSARRLQGVVDDLKATQSAAVRGETLRAIGQLSSGVAHHLNNLLMVIIGRTELLLSRVAEPEIRRALEVVLRTTQDGAEVVRRVQRFSRVDPVSKAVPVSLNHLVREVVDLTRPRWYDEAQLRGARIDVLVEPGPGPVAAAAEPAQLREVLMNLVLNAVDALPHGGQITIRTWSADERVHCTVMDTGVGMSDAVRQQALEPFFTTKGPKSMGLGLSVAYGTLQRYEGALVIDSTPGAGTRVTISLPAAAREDAPAAAPEPAPAASRTPTTTHGCGRPSSRSSRPTGTWSSTPREARRRSPSSRPTRRSTSCSPTSACRT
jgi:signal transduction histidine kinase